MKCGEVTLGQGQVEAVISRMGGYDNWLRYAGGVGQVVFPPDPPFLLGTIAAQPACTTSKQIFESMGVNWMGDNFETLFVGLEVSATKHTTLAVSKLEQCSVGGPILTELGNRAEITIFQFLVFLSQNKESSESFICYSRGKDGNLWAVDAVWSTGGGWDLGASFATGPFEWSVGSQFVSRK